jgi:hypothetical protein
MGEVVYGCVTLMKRVGHCNGLLKNPKPKIIVPNNLGF